jgi:hypothetical protein
MFVRFLICIWILWMGAGVQEHVTWRPIQAVIEGERSAQACLDLLNRVQPIQPQRTFQCLPKGTVPDGYQPPTVRSPYRLR